MHFLGLNCEGLSMRCNFKTSRKAITLAIFCLFLSCNNSSDSATTAEGGAVGTESTLVVLTSGMTDVATDAIIQYDFGILVDPATVNESSFFLAPFFDIDIPEDDMSSMVMKAQAQYSYDICKPGNASDAIRTCADTKCNINLSNDFVPGVNYYLCVTPAVRLLDGTTATATSIPFTVIGDTSDYCSALFNGSCSWDGTEDPADGDAVSYSNFHSTLSEFIETSTAVMNCYCSYITMGGHDTSSGCMSVDLILEYDEICTDDALSDNDGDYDLDEELDDRTLCTGNSKTSFACSSFDGDESGCIANIYVDYEESFSLYPCTYSGGLCEISEDNCVLDDELPCTTDSDCMSIVCDQGYCLPDDECIANPGTRVDYWACNCDADCESGVCDEEGNCAVTP